jgi:uncharacterized protein (DUF58 family)
VRLRKRAFGLLFGAGLLFFLGTNVQAGWLFVLAALLLGAVIAGLVLPITATRGIVVERRAPSEMHQGDRAFVDVIVHGGRRSTRRALIVRDPFLEAADLWVATVRDGERVEVSTMRSACRRGSHEPGHVTVRSAAPFGVAERRRRVAVEGSGTLVLPAVEPLGMLPFVRPASTSEVALHTAPRRGHGPEYLGIREYRPGDSMRHVHWASTARTGAMMVREFEQEQTRRLAIVLDASIDGEPDDDGLTPLDRACSAAASIALAALAQGHGARLVTSGREAGSTEVLAGANEQMLLERLALLRPAIAPTPFPDVVVEAAGSLRGVETAVLVFPTWSGHDPERLSPPVASLAAWVPTVVAVPVVIDPGAHAGAMRPDRVDGLVQRLRAAGASVRPWRIGGSLDAALGAADRDPLVRPTTLGSGARLR